ncbi:MAG: helix-hairpin-helix domain-containing protein [Vicinamibacterales bacterium]
MSWRQVAAGVLVMVACAGLPVAQAAQAQHKGTKAAAAGTKGGGKAAAGAADSATLLDINTATKEQLSTLSGIGDAYSDKIIAGRPYKTKADLVSRNIIPSATYDKIKGQIVARQAAGATTARASGAAKGTGKKSGAKH